MSHSKALKWQLPEHHKTSAKWNFNSCNWRLNDRFQEAPNGTLRHSVLGTMWSTAVPKCFIPVIKKEFQKDVGLWNPSMQDPLDLLAKKWRSLQTPCIISATEECTESPACDWNANIRNSTAPSKRHRVLGSQNVEQTHQGNQKRDFPAVRKLNLILHRINTETIIKLYGHKT